MTFAVKGSTARIEARLDALKQRGGVAEIIGEGPVRRETHVMLVVEDVRSIIVHRDVALRVVARTPWTDAATLERWREKLHDPRFPGLPVLYVVQDRQNGDGGATHLVSEEMDLPDDDGVCAHCATRTPLRAGGRVQ